MSRPLRLAGYILIGVLAGLLLASGIIFLLSRTDWGMERVRGFAVSWLAERVDGELRVGRVSGSGLLGGVIIHDFGIIDPKGRPFLATDSIELNYNIRTLLGGSIVLNQVVLYGPNIVLEQLPGDTAWNYEYVFPDRTPGDPTPPTRRLIMFNDALVVGGTATLRFPFEPDGPIEPRDTARVILDQLPGGLARVLRFENVNARLDRVIWESPLEPGRLVEVSSLATRGYLYRDPFLIQDADGTVTMRDTIVALEMQVELPGTRANVLGRVIMEEGRNNIDVRVASSRIAFSDLQFLHPQIPEEGGGSVVLRIQSQPTGILWLAEDARLSTPGTNVAGSFGVVTGDTLYFTRVDLRASPLDVQLIERLLPGGLPVDGLLIGTVEVSGPLSALQTSGDMRFAGGAGTDSELSWRGVLDVRNHTVSARSFNADVRHLELALVSAFAPELKLSGSVSGNIEGSGRLDRLAFSGLLEHASSDGGRSVFDGGGTVEGGGRSRRLDVTVNASPVRIHDLAQQVPALQGLQGELRGPVHMEGTADDFAFTADLATPGGPLALNGRVTGAGASRRIAATAEARGFRLDAFRDGLPSTSASGTLTIDVTGDALATMTGPVHLVLDSTRFGELPQSTLFLDGRLFDGLVAIDSAVLRGPLGTGRARGTIALVEAAKGARLEAGFTSESLTSLEPFLYRNRGPAVDGEARVAGRLDALATVTGWLHDLTIEATATGADILLGPTAAAHVEAQASAVGIGADAGFRLVVHADSAEVFSHPLQVARLEMAGSTDSMAVSVGAWEGGEDRLLASGGMRRSRGDSGTVGMTAHLDELRLGSTSPWVLSASAALHIGAGLATLDSVVLDRAAGGRAVAGGRLAWAESSTAPAERVEFRVGVTAFPFADLLRALRSNATGGGTVDGIMRVSGSALDPFIEAEVAAQDIIYDDVRIDRAFAELNYAALGMDAHAEAQYGGRSILAGGGRIPLDLRLVSVGERRLAEPLRITLTADSLPPGLPLGLVRGFTHVGGRIDGTMIIGGTTLDPSLSGGFTLRNGTADWDVSGVRYRDVTGNFVLEQGRLLRVDLTAISADPRGRSGLSFGGASGIGNGTIKGTLDFTELADPAFDLDLRANGVYAARRRDVEARVTGNVLLRGRYTRPELSGQLRVDDGALYLEELYRQYLIAGVELDDPSLLSLVDTTLVAVRPIIAASQNPFMKNLQVSNMQVTVGTDSWLRSRDMDVEVSGDLNVAFNRRDEDLRLSGSLNVERGTYTLYYPPLQSRRFHVEQGSIDFPGTPGIDPNLTITAAYKARASGEPLELLAVVSGTLQNPRVRLSSDVQPPISESDLASYLFFGVPTWEVANARGGEQNRMAGLGSALTPSVLGYASSGLQTLVQNAGLLDYVGLTAAESADTEPADAGLTNILAETQLEIGFYLTSDVYVGMSKRLGTSNLDPGARLEWRFLPEYSFEMFAEDRLARTPGFGLRQETGLRKVYGFLLFREWGF